MKYTHIHILVLMLAFCISCKGQGKTEPKNISASYVPTNSIRTVKQDRKGNMLLVSTEGIIRYDGKIFTNKRIVKKWEVGNKKRAVLMTALSPLWGL